MQKSPKSPATPYHLDKCVPLSLPDIETSRKWPQDAAPHTHLTESQQVFLDTTVISLVHFLVRRQAVEGEGKLAA